MALFKKILYFFGGKPPLVIFKNGEIYHDHPVSKWQAWKDRFEKNPSYNWKEHSGREGKFRASK